MKKLAAAFLILLLAFGVFTVSTGADEAEKPAEGGVPAPVTMEAAFSMAKETEAPEQLSLFRDHAAEEKARQAEDEALAKERKMQEALLAVRDKFGKNAIVKGLNLQQGATAIERNGQIGGHKK